MLGFFSGHQYCCHVPAVEFAVGLNNKLTSENKKLENVVASLTKVCRKRPHICARVRALPTPVWVVASWCFCFLRSWRKWTTRGLKLRWRRSNTTGLTFTREKSRKYRCCSRNWPRYQTTCVSNSHFSLCFTTTHPSTVVFDWKSPRWIFFLWISFRKLRWIRNSRQTMQRFVQKNR